MTYHSEVVGSMLRPTYLAEARKQLEAEEFSRYVQTFLTERD